MIAVERLEKRFGAEQVLRGVSLAVKAGEVAAVIGPSGSGKSTLLRCVNGLEPFDAGEVRVGEHVLGPGVHPRRDAGLLHAVRRTAGFVFQQFNLFPHLTVLGNLIEAPIHAWGEPRAAAEAKALALLERVGMPQKKDAYPRALSGGQQQRVAIARALMLEPRVLLLDEPTSALDPVMAGEVQAVLAALARGGQTMLLVTHALRLARGLATRVHVLAAGELVESGPPGEVLEAPRHPLARAFLEHERS